MLSSADNCKKKKQRLIKIFSMDLKRLFSPFLFVNGIGRKSDLEITIRNTHHTSKVGNLESM